MGQWVVGPAWILQAHFKLPNKYINIIIIFVLYGNKKTSMELNRKVRFSYVQKAVQLIYNVVQPIWDIGTRTGEIINNCPFLKKSTGAVCY